MNKNVKGALLLLTILLVAIGAFRLAKLLFDSDSGPTIYMTIGGDSYRGYELARSRSFKRLAAKDGVPINFVEDKGDIDQRFQKLVSGELDAAVMPVDRVLVYSLKYDFPAVITSVWSESVDADVILGKRSINAEADVTKMNDSSISVSYVDGTPMEFLTNLTVDKLDLYNLAASDRWRDKCASPQEVLQKAIRGEGDYFTLWEPEASQALAENTDLVRVFGSADLSGYIIDVMIVSKKFLSDNPDVVQRVTSAYFLALESYSGSPEELVAEMSERHGEKEDQIRRSLKKVRWFDLTDNCSEFFNVEPGPGVSAREGLVDTIQRCADVLLASKSITRSEYQQLQDPYQLIQSETIRYLKDAMPSIVRPQMAQQRKFASLSETEWKSLRQKKGIPLKIEPVKFRANESTLTEEGEASLIEISKMLRDSFGNYRAILKGHTGKADAQLSWDRAKVARQYLIAVGNVDANRLFAVGVGSLEPPVKRPGESRRDLRYRNARVEVILYKEATGFGG